MWLKKNKWKILIPALCIALIAAALIWANLPQDDPTDPTGPVCTISVSCAAILDNMELLNPEKTELVPADGWILAPVEVSFSEGEDALSLLKRVCRDRGIHLESSVGYVQGVGNIYEMDCGPLSGWTYTVNGESLNYGASDYELQEGDEIAFSYVCVFSWE